jgi:hypothetical protein
MKLHIKAICALLCAAALTTYCTYPADATAFEVELQSAADSCKAGDEIVFSLINPDAGVQNRYELRCEDSNVCVSKGDLPEIAATETIKNSFTIKMPNLSGSYKLIVFNGAYNRSVVSVEITGGKYSAFDLEMVKADDAAETPMGMKIRWAYDGTEPNFKASRAVSGEENPAEIRAAAITQISDFAYSLFDQNAVGAGEYTYEICGGSDELISVYVKIDSTGEASAQTGREWETVIFTIGSPDFIVGGEIKAIDKSNPAVVPIIADNRTYVPVRAFVENTGGAVEFDSSESGEQRVILTYEGGKTVELTIDSLEAEVNGESTALAAPPIIRNDRTLLPLRALEIIGAKLNWDADTTTVIILMPKLAPEA